MMKKEELAEVKAKSEAIIIAAEDKFEKEKEKEIVILIAQIIVDKILKDVTEKRDTISEIQP